MTVNLTFDIADLLGNDFDARRTKAWIETNIPGDAVVDTVGNKVYLGDAKATVNGDGTGSFTGLVATNATGLNLSGPFQYRVWIDYPRATGQQRTKWTSGWFSLTASGDLADVVAEEMIPPTYVSQLTQQLDDHEATLEGNLDTHAAGLEATMDTKAADASNSATAAANSASAAATSETNAAASAAAAAAPTDSMVAGRINDPTSATRSALNDSFAGKWKASTAYAAGDTVLAPDGSLVKAKVGFTSGTTYNAPNWTSVNATSGTQAQTELADSFIGSQIDFVELARTVSRRYTKMRFAKVSANLYQVRLNDGEKGITYQFIKDVDDDFIKLDACYTGYGDVVVGTASIASPGDTTGTWNTSTSSYYTTQVGATYTDTVRGSKIQARIVKESRGGLWNVSIDGGATIPISCYDPSGTTGIVTLVDVASGLTDTTHTLVWTYAGDDPAHAPSASPSRGYIRKDDTNGSLVGTVADSIGTVMVLADGSNKEMAFSCQLGAPYNWVPEHDGIGSAFKIDGPSFWLSGTLVDPTGWTNGQYQDITSFRLNQHFYGKIGTTNIMELRTVHSIDSAGMLSFDGRFKVLVDGLGMTGYPLMLPAGIGTNEFVSGLGTSKVNLADESYSYFTAERDNVPSGAVLSATNKNVIGAVRLKNPRLAFRKGKSGRPVMGQNLFLWNRASKPKMYWQPFAATTLNSTDAYAWSFDLMIADADNVYTMAKG